MSASQLPCHVARRRNMRDRIDAHAAAAVAAAPPITEDQCWRVYALLLARKTAPKPGRRGRRGVSRQDNARDVS